MAPEGYTCVTTEFVNLEKFILSLGNLKNYAVIVCWVANKRWIL